MFHESNCRRGRINGTINLRCTGKNRHEQFINGFRHWHWVHFRKRHVAHCDRVSFYFLSVVIEERGKSDKFTDLIKTYTHLFAMVFMFVSIKCSPSLSLDVVIKPKQLWCNANEMYIWMEYERWSAICKTCAGIVYINCIEF